MTTTKKKTDHDAEILRLDYLFGDGINFKDREIRITGEILENHTFDFIDAAMAEFERVSKAGITIKINSPGGSVYEALAIVDRIQESKCLVTTKCYGHAMSAAAMILSAGNKRYIGKRSWFMQHEISSGTFGTVSEMTDSLEQLKREQNEWARSMAEFTKKPIDFWLAVCKKKDFYLNAQECLEAGVVDGIF